MENKTIFEWAEMFQEQIQSGASQSDIVQMLEEYKIQDLRIHDVVGQSEQLAFLVEWLRDNYSIDIPDRLIDEYKRYNG